MTLFNEKVKGYIAHSIYMVVAVLIFLLQSSGLATFTAFDLFPQLMVSFTIFAGFFFREYTGIVFGFVYGLLLDTVSTGIIGFNTALLSLIGFLCGIAMTYLLNNNFVAAFFTNLIFTMFYYLVNWLFNYVFSSDSPVYFLKHNFILLLPSSKA